MGHAAATRAWLSLRRGISVPASPRSSADAPGMRQRATPRQTLGAELNGFRSIIAGLSKAHRPLGIGTTSPFAASARASKIIPRNRHFPGRRDRAIQVGADVATRTARAVKGDRMNSPMGTAPCRCRDGTCRRPFHRRCVRLACGPPLRPDHAATPGSRLASRRSRGQALQRRRSSRRYHFRHREHTTGPLS